jgi:hypothetical protein
MSSTTSCKLTQERKAQLELHATREGKTPSSILQGLIHDYLDEKEKEPSLRDCVREFFSLALTNRMMLGVLLENAVGAEQAERLVAGFKELGKQRAEELLALLSLQSDKDEEEE